MRKNTSNRSLHTALPGQPLTQWLGNVSPCQCVFLRQFRKMLLWVSTHGCILLSLMPSCYKSSIIQMGNIVRILILYIYRVLVTWPHPQLGASTKLQLCAEQYHCQCPRLLLRSTTYLQSVGTVRTTKPQSAWHNLIWVLHSWCTFCGWWRPLRSKCLTAIYPAATWLLNNVPIRVYAYSTRQWMASTYITYSNGEWTALQNFVNLLWQFEWRVRTRRYAHTWR